MSKALNAVLGIAIGIIVFITLIAFINVLYAEPQFDDFCDNTFRPDPIYSCAQNITVGECRADVEKGMAYDHECNDTYREAQDNYQSKYFYTAAILGLITVLASLATLRKIHIATGLILAGVILIFWSFIIGWSVTNELTRFLLALLNAVVIIYLGFRLSNEKPKKKRKRK